MVERTCCCAERTADINIRVGMKNPPADGTGGDVEITENKLCGIFVGPGQVGTTSVLSCDGEYLWHRSDRFIYFTLKGCDCVCFM